MDNRRIRAWLAAAFTVLGLTGCASPFEMEYSYSAPFAYSAGADSDGTTEIRNYNMLKAALTDLVNSHQEHGAFRFSSYDGSVADDLAAACLEIRTVNPLGAYAVDTLTSDSSRIVSYYLADVRITYKRTAEEIRAIVGVGELSELDERMQKAISEKRSGLVIRVYSALVDEAYLRQIAENCYIANPAALAAEPILNIQSYPAEGINHIYDISIQYGRHPSHLGKMTDELSECIQELTGTITGDSTAETALRCAETLWQQIGGEVMQGDSAYDALVRRNAGSKGISLAFKALCDALEIECLCVRGALRSGDAGEHWWNLIYLNGDWYHVDISCFDGDRAACFLQDDRGFWSGYIWDSEKYPASAGKQRYSDLVPPERPITVTGGREEGADAAPFTESENNDAAGYGAMLPEEITQPSEATMTPVGTETASPEESAPPNDTTTPMPSESVNSPSPAGQTTSPEPSEVIGPPAPSMPADSVEPSKENKDGSEEAAVSQPPPPPDTSHKGASETGESELPQPSEPVELPVTGADEETNND